MEKLVFFPRFTLPSRISFSLWKTDPHWVFDDFFLIQTKSTKCRGNTRCTTKFMQVKQGFARAIKANLTSVKAPFNCFKMEKYSPQWRANYIFLDSCYGIFKRISNLLYNWVPQSFITDFLIMLSSVPTRNWETLQGTAKFVLFTMHIWKKSD